MRVCTDAEVRLASDTEQTDRCGDGVILRVALAGGRSLCGVRRQAVDQTANVIGGIPGVAVAAKNAAFT